MALKDRIVQWMTPEYKPALEAGPNFQPVYDELDQHRKRIAVKLTPVAEGFIQITDLQFVPGHESLLIVLEKAGRAAWIDLNTGASGTWFKRNVIANSEQGLLGLAFDPKFSENGRFFINETVRADASDFTQVVALQIDTGEAVEKSKPRQVKTIIKVKQPYPNHNAGQLAFGPDNYLYFGLGDGGWADDPENNGQNKKALLGKMLRLDVSNIEAQAYVIPSDNPFVNNPAFAPEIWAWGLRNPWRYSFDSKGRLIVADVGQNEFEEVTILEAGDNAGWKIREAAHCFEPKENCPTTGLKDPIYEYGRTDGGSITGGFVYSNDEIPALQGLYVFADFLSGRLWAINVPSDNRLQTEAFSLGRWPMLPSTFAQDAKGHLYVGGFRGGTVYRLDPK